LFTEHLVAPLVETGGCLPPAPAGSGSVSPFLRIHWRRDGERETGLEAAGHDLQPPKGMFNLTGFRSEAPHLAANIPSPNSLDLWRTFLAARVEILIS
jgi:hypothetical protein